MSQELVLSIAKGALLVAAIALAALWLIGGVELAAPAALVAAAVALIEFLRESTKPQDRTIKDPAEAERLMDEATFAMAARGWPGNQTDADWVIEQVKKGLAHPALVPKLKAWRAVNAAVRGFERTAAVPSDPYGRVRMILDPVIAVLPSEERYLSAIKHVPPETRVSRLRAGYRRKISDGDDFWAWNYLLVLRDLGETETLLELLKERLVEMWKVEGGDPEHPPTLYKKAFVATAELAQEVKGTSFKVWYREHVVGSLRSEADRPVAAARSTGRTPIEPSQESDTITATTWDARAAVAEIVDCDRDELAPRIEAFLGGVRVHYSRDGESVGGLEVSEPVGDPDGSFKLTYSVTFIDAEGQMRLLADVRTERLVF